MKIKYESNLKFSEFTIAKIQTGIRYPTMLSPKHKHSINKNVRQSTTSNSLKLKGLGGALHPSRGACSIIDKPRYTSPPLANISLYTAICSKP